MPTVSKQKPGVYRQLQLWQVYSNVGIKFLASESKSNTITGLDRPLGVQQVEAPRIFRQSAHEGGKVVNPTHQAPLPRQEIFLVLISVRD